MRPQSSPGTEAFQLNLRGGSGRSARPCACAVDPYLDMVKITDIQDQAIHARLAGAMGAEIYDRLFASVRFDGIDGTMLCASASDEDVAAEIEDEFALHIAAIASLVLKKQIDIVVVMPKVLQ